MFKIELLSNCFKTELATFIHSNFNLPQVVIEENYKVNVFVFFEVTEKANFKVL